jgi:hypothetical protein
MVVLVACQSLVLAFISLTTRLAGFLAVQFPPPLGKHLTRGKDSRNTNERQGSGRD